MSTARTDQRPAIVLHTAMPAAPAGPPLRVISYRGPVSGAVIGGEHVGEHDVQPAPWRTPAAELHRELLGLGTVARLDRLDAALEAARRQGATEALGQAADELEQLRANDAATWLRLRANAHLSGQL